MLTRNPVKVRTLLLGLRPIRSLQVGRFKSSQAGWWMMY